MPNSLRWKEGDCHGLRQQVREADVAEVRVGLAPESLLVRVRRSGSQLVLRRFRLYFRLISPSAAPQHARLSSRQNQFQAPIAKLHILVQKYMRSCFFLFLFTLYKNKCECRNRKYKQRCSKQDNKGTRHSGHTHWFHVTAGIVKSVTVDHCVICANPSYNPL